MSLTTLLNTWRSQPNINNNITAWRAFPARPAQIAPFPPDLHPDLGNALRAHHIKTLYSHQAAAWQQTQAGHHTVIVTGTASGKSLCYNLPVLNHLLRHSEARALYLFPTKALAQDQAESLRHLLTAFKDPPLPGLGLATYDGDTPTSARSAIRQKARLLISNPDMLHLGVLPHHTRWVDFFRGLKFVVIDEMHIYRGVFGSHVANLLRRLKRITHLYGAAPQFILTSATIANPAELAERLIEAPVSLSDNDGAAKGTKHFLIYNPPIVNPDLGVRRSALRESVYLAQAMLTHKVQTIIFGRARRTVEMLLKYLRQRASVNSPLPANETAPPFDPTTAIRAYRSGYLPHQRREIEHGLRQGRIQAVATTSALELGIDIGGMGAAILTGYPGTIAGTWQQAGRAGRKAETSAAVLVTSANPLDQFLAHHPDYFFDRSPEHALINPDNLLILLQHLRCATFELPFATGDQFGRVAAAQVTAFLQFLAESGELHQAGDKYFWMAAQYPAQDVSLRSTSPETVLLQVEQEETWQTIGQVDRPSAPWMVHPQAIYLHDGQSYRVEKLDLEQNVAHLRPAQVDYYTEPRRETTVQLLEKMAEGNAPGALKAYGEIIVTTQVVGYQMIKWFTHERLGLGEVSLPPAELQTTGYWLALTAETIAHLRSQGVWRGDPNNYGPNWPSQRNLARARDGYRCQLCATPETGRAHDVHHKIPFRTFATPREANKLTNLVTLCRPCHGRAEMAVRMRSGLSGLSFSLGHLAPLFLMCDINDVAVHADPKSPLAEAQPAVVIYDMAPGGIGFSERLFERHNELVNRAYELVTDCLCAEGCPSCVGPAGEEGQGGKRETKAILAVLAGVSG